MRHPIVRGHHEPATTPMLTAGEARDTVHRPGLRTTADQTLALCLLETQRQVMRLEDIVHRLASVGGRGGRTPAGVMSRMQEGNLRLRHEVDQLLADAHAILRSVSPAPVPIARATDR